MRELSVRNLAAAAGRTGTTQPPGEGHATTSESAHNAEGAHGGGGGGGADSAFAAAPSPISGAAVDLTSYDDEVAVPSLLSRDSSQRVLSNSFASGGGATSPLPSGGFGRPGSTGGGGGGGSGSGGGGSGGGDAKNNAMSPEWGVNARASDPAPPAAAAPAAAAAAAAAAAVAAATAPAAAAAAAAAGQDDNPARKESGDRRRSSSRASALKVRPSASKCLPGRVLHYFTCCTFVCSFVPSLRCCGSLRWSVSTR